MARRLVTVAVLLGALGAPLFLPLTTLRSPAAWASWAEADRVAGLAATTAALAGLTLAVVLPLGVGLAVLLYRTDLPGRRLLRALFVAAMFVPLPLFALAWQSVGGGWRPWTHGLLPAAFVHAMAALPWVVWLTGLGLARVEPELEEDALTVMPAAGVLWRVSLRQAAPAVGLAAVWAALQTVGEITITDLGMVRTFAEEVYTQFVTGSRDALGRRGRARPADDRAAIVAVGWLLRAMGRPVARSPRRPGRPWSPGSAAAVAGVRGRPPLRGGLRRRPIRGPAPAGRRRRALDGAPPRGRSPPGLVAQWAHGPRQPGRSAAAGVLAAGLALVASWVRLDSRAVRRLLFLLAVALWAVPARSSGSGLKEAIDRLMDVEDVLLAWTSARPVRAVLYDLPTPLPVLWAHVARLFPYAVAVVWPAVRDVPRDLREAAWADGAGPWVEFWRVVWPATRGAAAAATVAVTALALAELGASKLVQVPGRQTFAQELWAQMHYAATATTAALGLVQLTLALVVWSFIATAWR